MESGEQSSGSDSYVGVIGLRSYDGKHRRPRATLHSTPEISLPATPAPRRGSVDTVNFYDLERGEAFSANQDKKGNWFVRKWDQATNVWNDAKSKTTLKFLKAVGPELLAATGKVVQAGGYEKTGKVMTATGSVVRGVVDSQAAYESREWNKGFSAAGGLVGAVAQYPFQQEVQNGLEAFALTSLAGGRAAANWPAEPQQQAFSTSLPLNTQIAPYANASPDSMSPIPNTPIGGASSGSEFEPQPPLRRRTTHQQAAPVQGVTSMLPPGHQEAPRRTRADAPPIARTTSLQVSPPGRKQSGRGNGQG